MEGIHTNRLMKFQPAVLAILIAGVIVVALMLLPTPHAQAAGITVNTTADTIADDGKCSLREAIIAANTDTTTTGCTAGSGGDTITLPAGTYTLSISGVEENAAATGDLDITAPLTITGATSTTTIIEGGPTFGDRLFHVTGGSTVFRHLTLRGGKATGIARFGSGGGIFNEGDDLIVEDCLITGNSAVTSGGGINSSGKIAHITHTRIYSNSATFDGGGIWFASAGFTSGFVIQLFIEGSVIDNNVAEANGGGIYSNNRGILVHNSWVTNNRATGNGGKGGGIGNYLGWGSIENSHIMGNHAENGGGVASGGTFTIASSEIMSNTAKNGAGVGSALILYVRNSTISHNVASELGGGLGSDSFIFSISLTNVDHTIISHNQAARGGGIASGGFFTLTNSLVFANNANIRGGGMTLGNGTVYITDSQILSNTAPVGAGLLQTFEKKYGSFTTTTSLAAVTVNGNQASTSGGGLSVLSGTLKLDASHITGNTAPTGAGLQVTGGKVDTKGSTLDNASGNCSLTGGETTSRGNNSSSDASCAAALTGPGDLNGDGTATSKHVYVPLIRR